MLSVRIWRRFSSDRPSEWSRAVRNQCSTLQSGISLLAVVNRTYVLMISRAAVYICSNARAFYVHVLNQRSVVVIVSTYQVLNYKWEQ